MGKTNYSALNDSTLAALSKKGDEAAFEEITLRYIKLIYSIASNYTSDGYDIQDFVQEGLLAFLIACKTYEEGSASFKTYAVKCAKNRFSDIVKKENQKSSVPKDRLVPMDNLSESEVESENLEDYVLEKEYLKTMLEHIQRQLSTDERKIFSMYARGYSYKEIAEELGTTPKNVDNILQKIKRKLRK